MVDLTAGVTDQVAAWATLAAVVVALGVSLVPVGWRWLTRPRLRWTVGRVEPYQRMIRSDRGRIESSYLRVRVTNEPGRLAIRPAENVRAQVETVWARNAGEPGEPRPWVNLGFDVTPLTWSSRRSDDPIAQQITIIASGSTDYATFAEWTRQPGNLVVCGARADDQQTMQRFGLGEYRLRIVLTANGLKPLIAHVSVMAQADAITEVGPSHEPPGPTV